MARNTGTGYLIETDVDQYLPTPTGTPDWQSLCPTSVTQNQNEETDTYYTLCSDISNNKVTALDLSWDITFKSDTTNQAGDSILGTRYTTDRTYPFRVTENDTGTQIEFNGEITDFASTHETEVVTEYTFSLKVADGNITVT